MKYLKTYNQFILEQNQEVVNFSKNFDLIGLIINDINEVTNAVKLKKTDITSTLGLNTEQFRPDMSIEELQENNNFNEALHNKNLSKSDIVNSDDIETFFK